MQLITIPDKRLKNKAFALEEILKVYSSPFFIACSGGLDSRFLAYFAQKIHCNFSLIHIIGTHIDPKETAYLNAWHKKHALSLQLLPLSVFTIPQIAYNTKERCYHCKKHSFQHMLTFIQNIAPSAILCDGSHADDQTAYRPGLLALKELNIQSPLALANIGKEDIRLLGKYIGLDNYTQKARPCLLTRLPYHFEIKEEILSTISKLEDFFEQELYTIFHKSKYEEIPDFRIRFYDGIFHFHYNKSIQKENLITLQRATKKVNMFPIQFEQLTQLSGYFDK